MTLFELWFSQGICPGVGLLSYIQNEVSQKQKNKYRMLTDTYIWNLKKMVLMNLRAGQE